MRRFLEPPFLLSALKIEAKSNSTPAGAAARGSAAPRHDSSDRAPASLRLVAGAHERRGAREESAHGRWAVGGRSALPR